MKQPLTYQEFKLIYGKVPRLNVELVVQSNRGVLLTKRAISPWRGFWHLPGGTVYFGETLHQAVHRIAQDELGVTVKIVRQEGYIEYPSASTQVDFAGWPIGVAFVVEKIDGDIVLNEQGETAQYFIELPEQIIPEQKTYLENLGYTA